MGHRSAFTGFKRQAGLGAIQGLDLGFLVDRQNNGVSRRRHVEADDVLELGNEIRIVRSLEGAKTMGLEVVCLPNPLDCAQGHAHDFGHGSSRPMRRFTRGVAASQGD